MINMLFIYVYFLFQTCPFFNSVSQFCGDPKGHSNGSGMGSVQEANMEISIPSLGATKKRNNQNGRSIEPANRLVLVS